MVRLLPLCLALMLWHLSEVNMQDCPNNFGPEGDSRIQRVPGKRGEPGIVDYGKVEGMIQETQNQGLAKIRDDISSLSGRVDKLFDTQGMEDLRSDMNILNDRIRTMPSFKEIRELENEVEDLENKLMTEMKTKLEEMSVMVKGESLDFNQASGAAAELKKVPQVIDDFVEKKISELTKKFENNVKSEVQKARRKMEKSCKKMEKMTEEFTSDLAKVNEKLDRLQLTPSPTTRKPTPTDKPVETTAKKSRTEGLCHVSHAGMCYWVATHSTYYENYEVSMKECTSSGGAAADIIDRDHFDKLKKYIKGRKSIGWAFGTDMYDYEAIQYIEESKSAYSSFWTGMKYDYETGKVLLSTGQEPAFVKWSLSGEPRNMTSETIIQVRSSAVFAAFTWLNMEGMVVARPESSASGIICQIEA